MTSPKIDILLAVCEGEQHLEEQIQSILKMDLDESFRLIIRDDASKDQSANIIHKIAAENPNKIKILPSKERLGVKANFSTLMAASTAPYVMFSDQDDYWLPQKAKKTLLLMQEMEKLHINQPLLVHSDLAVVDAHLNLKNPSFWNFSNIKPLHTDHLNRLLNQNVVTGCTMMANRLLIEIAQPIPNESFMHDWWLALTAAALGKIGAIPDPLIQYRQHSHNTLGAQKFGSLTNLQKNFQKLLNKDIRKYQQAAVFYHRYQEFLSTEQRDACKAFLRMPQQSWIEKRQTIYKYGFYKQGFLRNFADFLLG